MRPTRAEVNLGAIKENIQQIRHRVGEKTKILACVKADAYGHGAVEVSQAIKEEVDYLGVALPEEGGVLRERGINLPILVLSNILPEETGEVVDYDLAQTLSSLEVAEALDKQAAKKNKQIKVHVKVDTGMGRIGIKPEETLGFAKKVKGLSNLHLEGLLTHFPSADEADTTFTYDQIEVFKRLLQKLEGESVFIPLKHTANSGAILSIQESYFNMVRPGLMVYGYYPSPEVSRELKLSPALSLKTKIVLIRDLPKGASVSYGRTYITPKKSKVAVLPIGYGDGYSRHFSNRGKVLIRGRKVPIVGRICMDQTMVDVSELREAKVGDEIVIIGSQDQEKITMEEVAQSIGTIPNEITCMLGKRVPRIYLNGE